MEMDVTIFINNEHKLKYNKSPIILLIKYINFNFVIN